jgi:hypothetical protein
VIAAARIRPDRTAHLGLVATLAEAGRHGEARRRYRSYAERMDEIDVEVEAFPAAGRAGTPPGRSGATG